MRTKITAGVTLIEVLIAFILLTIVIFAVTNMEAFSRYHLLTSDHRAKLQNEVSLALEHMTKQMQDAYGNEAASGADSVIAINPLPPNIMCTKNLLFRRADGTQGEYCFRDHTNVNPTWRDNILYCSSCFGNFCGESCPGEKEVLASKITAFNVTKPVDAVNNTLNANYVDVEVSARWDPTTSESTSNPGVTMKTRIYLPGVSTH